MQTLHVLERIHPYNSYSFCPQVVKNNLNPTWRPFRIPLQSLCGGDMDKPIKVPTMLFLNICNLI